MNERLERRVTGSVADVSRTAAAGVPGGGSMCGHARTWAKAILMGEHSVVYGYPAIAVPLTTLTMQAWAVPLAPGETDMLHALDYDGPLDESGVRFAGLRRAVHVARRFAGCSTTVFDIATRAAFPDGRGLGSSAASSGAVVRAVVNACGAQASSRQLMALTNEAEIVTHGHPSGLDTVTTCAASPVRFEGGSMYEVGVGAPAYLVIADCGIPGSTLEAVDAVQRLVESDHARTVSILDRLGSLAGDSVGCLERGDMAQLGASMNAAHELLDALQVSHPAVNRLVDVARTHGALGAKMTGGGLGGCVIALCGDENSALRIRHAFECAQAQTSWVHRIDPRRSTDARGIDFRSVESTLSDSSREGERMQSADVD